MKDLYRGDGGPLSSYDEGWNDGVEAAEKAIRAENDARRGVEAPAIEDRNARFAIEGCIEYGRQGVNPPPDDHWLAPFWHMGKQLSEIAEKDDRLTHLEEAYQSAMRVGSEAQRRAEEAVAERDAAVVANCPRMCDDFCNEYQTVLRAEKAEADEQGLLADIERLGVECDAALAEAHVKLKGHEEQARSFHEEYRRKCDLETKNLEAELAAIKAAQEGK